MIVVSGAQVLVGYVSVDLRGRDVAMTQQRLHRARVGAVLQQVRGKTVTQRVGRNITDANALCITLDCGPGKVARQRLAAVKKQIWVRRLSILCLQRRILLQPMNRAFAQRHAPLFASFAMTINDAAMQINVGLFQRNHL